MCKMDRRTSAAAGPGSDQDFATASGSAALRAHPLSSASLSGVKRRTEEFLDDCASAPSPKRQPTEFEGCLNEFDVLPPFDTVDFDTLKKMFHINREELIEWRRKIATRKLVHDLNRSSYITARNDCCASMNDSTWIEVTQAFDKYRNALFEYDSVKTYEAECSDWNVELNCSPDHLTKLALYDLVKESTDFLDRVTGAYLEFHRIHKVGTYHPRSLGHQD